MPDQEPSPDAATNPRGIPYAPFVDKVEDYVSSRAEVEGTLKRFQEMISKYQFMEVNTQRRLAGLKEKIPDIRKTVEMVRFLQTRSKKARRSKDNPSQEEEGSDEDENEQPEPTETTFELNDTLYAKAHVPPTEEVYLWLGANVMLSYPLPDALALLTTKLATAHQNRSNAEEDLDFLREQITTLEVALARVYNWEVTQKRREKEGAGGKGGKEADEEKTGGDGNGS
ncbi:MAG: peptide chain release factor 1 [Caeruleum heppii]|nr:MAG: peptide chain release factor 1 [Caeruleum heppii]